MRKIIILQSLLILAGAYYIYTLQQSAVPEETIETEVTEEMSDQGNEVAEEALDTESDSSDTATTTEISSDSSISGPSDVGMEFPIPDDEAELQVR